MTSYLILAAAKSDDGTYKSGKYSTVCSVDATSADQAIRLKVTQPGCYVAVPERMFRPALVDIETTPRVLVRHEDA